MVKAPLTFGAVVQSIHSDQTKIILSLSQEEMADLKLKVETPLQIQSAKETFFTYGTPRNLNPLRKTVVIDLVEPDERIKTKQKIILLPKIRNAILSPVIQSPSQLYQYTYPLAAAGLGGIYDFKKVTTTDRFVATSATGSSTSFLGFFNFLPGFLDGSLGFYSSDSQIKKVDTPVDANLPIVTIKDRFETTKLEPGLMWTINETYTLGFRYDWSAIKSRQGNGSQNLTYNYTFAEPLISLTARSSTSEKTIRYKGQDSSQGALANRNVSTTQAQVKPETTTLPASLEISYRYLAPTRFACTTSLGYLLDPPKSADNSAQTTASTKPKPPEKILWQTILEHRLNQGDRIDYVLAYRGSQGRGISRITQETNTLRSGLHLTRPYAQGWSLGVGAYAEAGSLSTTPVPSTDPNIQVTNASDKTTSYAALLLINIQKDFPMGRQKRTTRPL